MLEWSHQFETGHAVVDSQHRRLIGYINQLEEHALNVNPGSEQRESLSCLMDFLETYMQTHFTAEEECMNRFHCPAHLTNNKAHLEFLSFFRRYKRRLQAEGNRPEALQELHEACKLWIQAHILRIDVRLNECQGPGGPSGARLPPI